MSVGQSSLRMTALKDFTWQGGESQAERTVNRQESRAHRRKEGEAVLFVWVCGWCVAGVVGGEEELMRN